jgi:hypothetical protein
MRIITVKILREWQPQSTPMARLRARVKRQGRETEEERR